MKLDVVAIVPAAGLGKRFGTSERKQFAKVAGIPLLLYTLKGLHKTRHITEIIPVLRQEDMERGLEIIESRNLYKIRKIAPGGTERQDSINNALKLIKEKCLILIHDGARPLVSCGLIERLLQGIKGFDGVIPGLPVRDTLKEVNSKGLVLSTVKRESFWTVQTPQIFNSLVIKKAYDKAYKKGFYATDDAALVERIGGKIRVIAGDPFNIKVTTPEDLKLAEYLITVRNKNKKILNRF